MQNVEKYKKDSIFSAFVSPAFILAIACMAFFWWTIVKYDANDSSASDKNAALIAKAGPEIIDQINAMRPMKLASAGQLEEATKAASDLLAKKSYDACANMCAGNVFLLAGINDKGLDYLKKGVALSHGNRYFRLNYAKKLVQLGKTDDAIAQYQALEKIDNTWDVPHLDMANIYLSTKKPDLAAQELKAVLDNDDKNFRARKARGLALARAGKMAAGLDEYVLACSQETQSGPPEALKDFLGKQGNIAVDRVTYELQQQVNNRPDDYVPKLRLAQLYAYTGNASDAKDLLMDARRLAPNNPEVHRTLAVVLKQLGEDNQAISSFALSVKLEEVQEKERAAAAH